MATVHGVACPNRRPRSVIATGRGISLSLLHSPMQKRANGTLCGCASCSTHCDRTVVPGAYVNYLGGDEWPRRIAVQHMEPRSRQLAAIKAKYDPANFIRLNQNIAPAPLADARRG